MPQPRFLALALERLIGFVASPPGKDRIGEDVVELLNSVYEAHTAREPWQAGDLMLVDNIRTAHSREPFEGPREVLVALADPVRLTDCSPTVEVTAS